MTRDEAIKLLGVHLPPMADGYYGKLIDAFGALGMLKLDEPKSLPQKLRDLVMDTRLAQGDAMERLGNLGEVLSEHGLKIVEK